MPKPVAVITGASRGIGAATARRLVTAGYRVWGLYREGHDEADAVRDALGEAFTPYACDITQQTQVNDVVDHIVEEDGHLDLLVNNAGITRDKLLLATSDADWDAVVAVNLTGAMRMSRAALGPMLDQRAGSIINVSSASAQIADAGQTAYAASKAGLEGFTRALAAEVGHKGIRVNAVSPGRIRTDMSAVAAERLSADGGRWGEPEDIAEAICFLAGARHLQGQVLLLDGGNGISRRLA